MFPLSSPIMPPAKRPAQMDAEDSQLHMEHLDHDAAVSDTASQRSGSSDTVLALSETASVADKIQAVRALELSDGEKLKHLQRMLSTNDWTKLNMNANYAAKKDATLHQDMQAASSEGGRAQRRHIIMAWALDPSKGKCYKHIAQGVSQEVEWKSEEHWQGINSFVPCKWTEQEFHKMIDAGRVKWRPMVGCPDVYEYWDVGDQTTTRTTKKSRRLEAHQSDDIAPETDQAEDFKRTMDDIHGLHAPTLGTAVWDAGAGKGKSKGSSSSSSSSTDPQLALQDWHTHPTGHPAKGQSKGSNKLSEEQKTEKRAKTMSTCIKNAIKDVDAALYNNGKKVSDARKKKLLDFKHTLAKSVVKPEHFDTIGKLVKEVKAYINASKN